MSVLARLAWVVLGVALGVAASKALAGRGAPAEPERTALPPAPPPALPRPPAPDATPSGRHAWKPPPDEASTPA